MVCPSCGHEVSEGANFCLNCGAKLEMEAAETQAPILFHQLLGVLSGGDVSLHKVEVHTVVGLLGLGGVLLLLLNDQGEVGMLGNLLGQFLIDGAKTLACLVKTGLGADDLLVDEIDGETDGVLLHNFSFLVPFGTVAFIREPYPLII